MSTTYDYTHALNELKGWPFGSVLDFRAKLDTAVTGNAYAGRVVHVDATSGAFQLGAKITQMPIFLRKSSTAFDVSNSSGNDWTAVAPVGWMTGLVATGGYELQTTEYATADAASMVPNAILHAPTEDQCTAAGGVALAGQLHATKSYASGGGSLTLYTDLVCGVVSRAVAKNNYGVNVVSFWPVYLPGTA